MECPFKEFAGIAQRMEAVEKELFQLSTLLNELASRSEERMQESTKLKMVPDREYNLTVEQAAQITGYKPNYIYQLIREKALPYMKVRGKVRFDRRELTE